MTRDEHRTASILAAYGPAGARSEAAMAGFAAAVGQRHPGSPVRWAFTGPEFDPGPGPVLSGLRDEEFRRVAVLPLHVIDGHEQRALGRSVASWLRDQPGVRVELACPLLNSSEAMGRVAAMLGRIGQAEALPGEFPVWIGHGGRGRDHECFARMAAVAATAKPPVAMGFLLGKPGIPEIVALARQAGQTRLCLLSFLALPGRHAIRDVAGTDPGSWESVLRDQGFATRSVVTGLVEHPELAALWLERLDTAMAALTRERT